MSGNDLIGQVCDVIDIDDGPEVFLETFHTVDLNPGLFYAACFAQSEICNGGFDQFFRNSTGVLAPEAIRGFELIGMPETARLVRTVSLLLGEPYPRDRTKRQTILSHISKEELDGLNDQFFERLGGENGGYESASETFANTL